MKREGKVSKLNTIKEDLNKVSDLADTNYVTQG